LNSDNRTIQIVGINPADLFGTNNINLKHFNSFFPKLSVLSRGHEITIKGDQEVMDEFERKFNLLILHYTKFNSLSINNIDNLLLDDGETLLNYKVEDEILVHGNKDLRLKHALSIKKN